jgi:nucleoside-diphosphate-sugar epimerase
MKVLVTGATGYIGTAVCEVLRAQGHQVVGMTRSAEKGRELEARGYSAVVGDIQDTALLREAASAADGVIHAAREAGHGSGALDRLAMETLIEALSGRRAPLVYSSGVWVMGDTRGRMLGEIARPDPPPMVAWRPAVEELVLASTGRGVKGVVLRPGTVFGRNGGRIAAMFRDAREHGEVRIVGEGNNHWSTIHVDDLAQLYAHAVTNPAAGELFIACGGMPQPLEKIARAVVKACGGGAQVRRVPLEEARQQMGPLADCLAMDCRAGSTKAARYFGWAVRKPSVFDEILSGSYVAG